MPGYYLINNKIRFIPEDNKLLASGADNAVALFKPVTDCLLLLIENKTRVISQDEMMQKIWGNKGSYVSPNTLYQTISLLRKAIRSAGCEEDMIVTVPKKGTRLAESVIVDYVEENDTLIPSAEDRKEGGGTVPGAVPLYQGSKKSEWGKRKNLLIKGTAVLTMFLLITALIIGLLSPEYVKNTDKRVFFANYVFFRAGEGCKYYASPKNIRFQHSRLDTIVNDQAPWCRDNENVYITLSDIMEGASILKCSSKNDYCEVILKRVK